MPLIFFSLDGLNIFKLIPVAPSCILKTLIGKETTADIDDEAVAMLVGGGWVGGGDHHFD